MLDKLKPYPLDFIQKASPGKGDAFDYAYIYKFYTERTAISQRLKYIIRVEAYEDVFAVKFYAARDRKLDNKYNRILRVLYMRKRWLLSLPSTLSLLKSLLSAPLIMYEWYG